MVNLLFSAALVALTVTYAQAGCEYGGFLTCLNNTILNEWKELDADSEGKLAKDKAKSITCLRTVKCTKDCVPAADFTDELSDDPSIQKLVRDIKGVWEGWPRTMQSCFLEKVRDNFFKDVEKRVKNTQPDFNLPEHLGSLPMPSPEMYKNKRAALNSYVGDRIGALLCLSNCPYDKKKEVVKCMKKEIDGPLGVCVSTKLCSSEECSNKFKPTCAAVSDAIQAIVKDGDSKLSSFEDSQQNALKELKRCKDLTVELEGVRESDFYHPSHYLKIFGDFTHVKAEKKTEKFKNLLKDLFNSYFDGDSFCTSQGC